MKQLALISTAILFLVPAEPSGLSGQHRNGERTGVLYPARLVCPSGKRVVLAEQKGPATSDIMRDYCYEGAGGACTPGSPCFTSWLQNQDECSGLLSFVSNKTVQIPRLDGGGGMMTFTISDMQGEDLPHFRAACNVHDLCYSTDNTQQECDSWFHRNMRGICELHFSWFPSVLSPRDACLGDATIAYEAVKAYGSGPPGGKAYGTSWRNNDDRRPVLNAAPPSPTQTYEVTLHYFTLNHVDAYECTNEWSPHIYYRFRVGNDAGYTDVAARSRDDYRTMQNGDHSRRLMNTPHRVTVGGGTLQIEARIWDSDTGGGIVDADDPIAVWYLRWDHAEIAAAKRDRNGTIHSGIGLRENKCDVSFWYTINKVG